MARLLKVRINNQTNRVHVAARCIDEQEYKESLTNFPGKVFKAFAPVSNIIKLVYGYWYFEYGNPETLEVGLLGIKDEITINYHGDNQNKE